MDEHTSLINIGELSKPATMLVEKISDAVGGIFKPYQIVRVAKAEAQADRVRADSQIEISDLQRRAFHRFLEGEAKKQMNIEDITQKALPLLNENSKPKEVEDDWITNFFDRCRLISDDDMQSLWSRVLAGEANSPGTYSKRTLGFLSDLDKYEAEMFTRLCGFVWQVRELVPLIYDETQEIYNKHGIDPGAVMDLETIGLIQYELVGFRRVKLPKRLPVSYYGTKLILNLPHETGNELEDGSSAYENWPRTGSDMRKQTS
jgi:Protein of unknown function (DUF2806)